MGENIKEVKVKSKVLLKHELEAHWMNSSYLPEKGEIVIYDREIDKNGNTLALPEGRAKAYTYQRMKLGDGVKNVNQLPFFGDAINTVEELPKVPFETGFYSFEETVKKFYAVSSARKNIVNKEINGVEYDVEIDLNKVTSLPSSGTDVVDSITSPTKITLYYVKEKENEPGVARAYVSGTLYLKLLGASALGGFDIEGVQSGWNDPTAFISNYAGVIDDVFKAEYGKVYIVDGIEKIRHTLQYANDNWYELALEPEDKLVSRLGEVLKNKFETEKEENINVNAYKNLNNNFDRVYVEQAGNIGVSGDYCLTPSIQHLPEDPWTTPETGVVHRIPSVPMRLEDGTIEVYVDENSADASAISKKYLEDTLAEYVHRKPEESLEVANAGLVAAHTWTPNSDGYSKHTEKFEGEDIPDNIVHLASLGTGNTLSIDTTNKYLKCEKASGSGGTTMYFTRQDTYAPAAFTFDLYLNPAEECLAKACRGLSVTPYNSAQGGNAIWSSLCNFAIISRTAGKYFLEISNVEICDLTPYIGEWFNFRMELDDLTKGAERRIYINNKLVNKNTIGAALTGMKSFQMQVLPYKSGEGSTFVGEIGIDNVYFGEVPPEVKHNGYDTITAIAYDYEDAAVQSLNGETIVSRKPDGSILTKKELTDADDDRIAVSKYYVDNAAVLSTLSVTYAELKTLRDNGKLTPGRCYRIIDYVCTTTQEDTWAVGEPFDIIVQALTEKSLSENAKACRSDREYQFIDYIIEGDFVEDIHYVEYIDTEVTNEQGPIEYNSLKDIVIAYDYLKNNEGKVVPVIYKTDRAAFEANDPEYSGPDYHDQFYYIGRELVNGKYYSKWRKITSEWLKWDSVEQIYIYTDVIVEQTNLYAHQNINAWDLKYSLDNDTDRFYWADAEKGRGVIYYMKDEHNNECPYDFQNIKFNVDIGGGDMYYHYTFYDGEDLSQQCSHEAYSCSLFPWFIQTEDNIRQKLNFIVINTMGVEYTNLKIEGNCHNLNVGSNYNVNNVTISSGIFEKDINIPKSSSPIIYHNTNTREIILD